MADIQGIVFDKDGTLFNFQASWGIWSAGLVADLAGGDGALAARLAAAIGYDLATGAFAPDSPVIAATPVEIAQCLLTHLPGMTMAGLVARMNMLSAGARMAEAVPLVALLDQLRARGIKIGLATNDSEAPARAHLAAAGIAGHFDFVAGSDSGYGGKPAPGMLQAFASALALDPGDVVMVGDSLHDLMAGRAAGMATIGVLTGPAAAHVLAPMADAVLPDIGHLPAWLDGHQLQR